MLMQTFKINKKLFYLILLGGLLLVVGGIFITINIQLDSRKTVLAPPNNTKQPILAQAISNLDSSKVVQLEQIKNSIQKLPAYNQDPNYLYVILVFYINTSNSREARIYVNKLEQVIGLNKQLNPALNSYKSLGTLKSDVNLLEQQSTAYKKSVDIFNGFKQ